MLFLVCDPKEGDVVPAAVAEAVSWDRLCGAIWPSDQVGNLGSLGNGALLYNCKVRVHHIVNTVLRGVLWLHCHLRLRVEGATGPLSIRERRLQLCACCN